jgi:5'-nucleotidase (lipoprotein e(P4) family)
MTEFINYSSSRRRSTLLAALIALALLAPAAAPKKTAEKKTAPATNSDTYFNANNAPLALLWATQSAEYEALCLQTYNLATAYVRNEVAAKGLTVEGKPVAVVMDLDETVLDNFAYNDWLYATGKGIDWDYWADWERSCGCNVGLIPGALDFIKAARAQGVAVIFISNREAPRREFTVATLVRLGVIASAAEVEGDHADRLLLYEGKSDKNPRRDQTTARYHVIAWLGDSLGDFPGGFHPPTAAERKAQVQAEKNRWGAGYFILPNPTYGKWLDYLDPKDPAAALPLPTDCGGCPFPRK